MAANDTMTAPRRALFLDRDGVVNEPPRPGDYILHPADLVLRRGIADLIRAARAAGYLVIVVTNQRCVGRGLISRRRLDAIHDHMRTELARQGAGVDDVFVCPHDLDAHCACRKPNPGMILAARDQWNLDLSASVLIGDSPSDLEAARRAGCIGRLVSHSHLPASILDDLPPIAPTCHR